MAFEREIAQNCNENQKKVSRQTFGPYSPRIWMLPLLLIRMANLYANEIKHSNKVHNLMELGSTDRIGHIETQPNRKTQD